MNTNSEHAMTVGDVQAELDRTTPKMTKAPPTLYDTTPRVLPPARRVIAVSTSAAVHNTRLDSLKEYMSVVEVYAVPENGTLKDDATPVGVFRHVEILGPSWIHHNPEDSLEYARRRSTVLETTSALRVYEDTAAQIELSGEAMIGC